MYKVLIVDDEPFVRQNIIARLQRSSLETIVVGEAESARIGSNLFDLHLPDVVFVDINMPEIDGLDMIVEIKRKHPDHHCRFIVISGYDDFSHLQRAIRSGVDNYIHKPIVQDEFVQVLTQELHTLEKKRKASMKDRKGITRLFPYDLAAGWLFDVGNCYLFHRVDGRALTTDELEFAGCIAEMKNPTYFSFEQISGLLLVVDRRKTPTNLDSIRMMVEQWSKCLRVQIVYGNFVNESLLSIANRLERFLQLRFLKQNSPVQVISSDEDSVSEMKFHLETFSALLERGHVQQAIDWLREQKAFGSLDRDSLLQSKQLYYHLVLELVNQYVRFGENPMEELRREMQLFSCARFDSLEEMRNQLEHLILNFEREYQKNSDPNDVVEAARRYLEQHFSEEISLQSMANDLFVSSAYLSIRFKNKMGQTMVQYLEDLRMKRAAEYLQLGKLSVSEVAELVGYHDASYFTRVFRKTYGMSPRSYREKSQ
jgi:two-component system response regulator YesN